MQEQDKFASIEATVAKLVETFPACFTAEGEALPLKIGIFQDISAHFADDETISNTRLRQALRRYTASWRYLNCVKEGKTRVDLNGEPAGEITAEHAEHAQKQLEESKARAKARRPQKKADPAKERAKSKNGTSKPTRSSKSKVAPAPKRPEKTHTADDFVVGGRVKVWAGAKPVDAEVLEIQKDQVQVRLPNGLVMRVSASQLEPTK